MKRNAALLILAASLTLGGCTTTVAVRPPHPGMVRVEGRWVTPPYPGAVWVSGHAAWRGAYRVWVPGHWTR